MMSRKVFMSVLGATNYQNCWYVDASTGFKSSHTKYVQIAMLEKIAELWSEDDAVYVFLTQGEKGSKIRNWE